jgi:hypothetical protein
LHQVARYGVFVVPVGEVERWLQHLNIAAAKPAWLPAIFERMGADSAAPEYVRPTENDVWAFIRGVARWINDPNRAVHVGQRRIGSG